MRLPEPYYEAEGVTVHHGDCLDVLAAMDAATVDAILTDPPYGLEFMGSEWDAPWKTGDGFRRSRNPADAGRDDAFGRASRRGPEYVAGVGFQQWCEAWAAECLRVLKPGGHLVAFGGTRTYHRLTAGIEDAGFEIRDCLAWLYGSGFPKSLDVSKAIDKAAGAEREVVGRKSDPRYAYAFKGNSSAPMGNIDPRRERPDQADLTAPATPEAQQWDGWGTALKPAHEPIVLARKPLAGTVAGNVLEHGTGALNVDGCRVGTDGGAQRSEGDVQAHGNPNAVLGAGLDLANAAPRVPGLGRWPANVVLDPEAAALLDAQTGTLTSGTAAEGGHRRNSDKHRNAYAPFKGQEVEGDVLYGDSGGASRFFYTAKASRHDRGEGNSHPTVKPVDLMRWLVRLVTPPGGIVLDPFAGSGTTGVACVIEGFPAILIEREDEYVEIIRKRLSRPIEPVLFGGAA